MSPATRRCAALLVLLLAAAEAGFAQEDLVLEHRLDNGLVIWAAPLPDCPVVYCRLVHRGGQALEPAGLEGLTRLLQRLSTHGTIRIGSRNAAEELSILRDIETTRASREEQLAQLPEQMFLKLDGLPRQIAQIRERLRTRLRALDTPNLPPMSRKEMEDILAFVRGEYKRIADMNAELANVQAGPHFRAFERVRVLDEKIASDSRRLAGLLLPDPVRATYRAGGALETSRALGPDAHLFGATLPANRVELFLWIESRRMAEPVFRFLRPEIARTVLEARDALAHPGAADTDRRVTFPDHPYGRPLAAPDALADLQGDRALALYRDAVRPDRTTLVVVGDMDPDNVFFLAEQHFGRIPALEAPVPEPPPSPAGPLLLYRYDRSPAVELRYLLPGAGEDDWPALDAFAEILRIRLEGPMSLLPPVLAPSCTVEIRKHALASLLVLRALPAPGVGPHHLSLEVQTLVRDLASAKVDALLLDRARQCLRRRIAERTESPAALADYLATAAGCGERAAGAIAALAQLEPEAVEKTAWKHLSSAEPVEILTEEVRR